MLCKIGKETFPSKCAFFLLCCYSFLKGTYWVFMSKLRIILFTFSVLLLAPSAFANGGKVIVPVYVYHQQPPYIISSSEKSGLYFDFVKHLNALSKNYFFEVTFMPRKRVERMLEKQTMDGILLGVNPKWFKDKTETKYLWTAEVFNDRDEVVSLKSKSIEFSGADSLTDMVVGGVRGFYYYGINELVAAKKAKRIDTVSEPDLFMMMLKERVDVTILSLLTYNYMVKENNWQNEFYLSVIPHDIYQRRILVPRNMKQAYQPLQELITQIQQNKSWQDKILSYQ